MRNAMSLLLFLALLLPTLLSGCGGKAAGFASSSVVPEMPGPGSAKVYFYRIYEPYPRMQEPIYVHAGEDVLGRVMPGTFIAVDVLPGFHHFWAARSEKGYVELEAEPGDVFFVRLSTTQGIFVPQPVMIPTMPEMAMSRIKTLQRVQ